VKKEESSRRRVPGATPFASTSADGLTSPGLSATRALGAVSARGRGIGAEGHRALVASRTSGGSLPPWASP
jgi:hypothetical protein